MFVKRLLRRLVWLRVYSDVGMWYFPGMEMILPILTGVWAGWQLAVATYIGLRLAAAVLGWLDVHYFKRIQYQNAVATQLNPFLLKEIRKRKK